MCKIEERERIEGGEGRERRWRRGMGLKGKKGMEKNSADSCKCGMKAWMIRATSSVVLWTCLVQLTSLRDLWGLSVLKAWPSCFSHDAALPVKLPPAFPVTLLPSKSE